MGSGFASLHPALSFAYFVLLVIYAMVFMHPVYLLSILLCTVILNILLDQGESLKKNIKFYLIMAGVIIVLNPLFTGRGATILFYFRDRPVTLEAISYGVLFALTLLGILIAFLAYNRVITPDRFLYLFSSIAPKTTFNITVILRFIPLMKRRLQEITAVQQAIGGYTGKTKVQKAKEGMETLNILVSWSLESSLQTAASMRARGYETPGKRSSAVVYRLDKRDLFWLSFMSFTAVLSLVGLYFGYGQFEVYPRLDKLFPVFTWHYIVTLLFLAFPIYIESRELIQWHFIRSKI